MEQGLRQECVLAPVLFNILLPAVINVASTRFKVDASVHLKKKMGAGGTGGAGGSSCRRVSPHDADLRHALW